MDYRTHFIADFIKETHKNKFNSLYYNGSRNGFLKVVFLLDKEGFIKDTQIIEKSGSSYEYKLVDIFNSADPISPGYINGKPAMFMGQFEIKDDKLDTIRVYWTALSQIQISTNQRIAVQMKKGIKKYLKNLSAKNKNAIFAPAL